jgi:hypothetical protein
MALEPRPSLQSLCELGQEALMRMEYLEAQRHLARAEIMGWEMGDFDTLARLYMPLQEARRQIRQRCGEGTVAAIVAAGPEEVLEPNEIVGRYPAGQLLVAGYDSIEPALGVRRLADQRNLYLECFLGAVVSNHGQGGAIVVHPLVNEADESSPLQLSPHLFPAEPAKGDTMTYAKVMALWETLHLPFLGAADEEADPFKKAHSYRRAIEVDYACELAHQKLSDVVRQLARRRRHG